MSLLFEDRSGWTSTCGCYLTTFFCWASCLHVLLNKYIFMCVCVYTNCPMISFFKVWDHDFMSDTIFLLRVLILHASSCVCASVEIFLCVCVYVTLARWSVFLKFEITILWVTPYFCRKFYFHFYVHVHMCVCVCGDLVCVCLCVYYLPDDSFLKFEITIFMSDTIFLLRANNI